MYTSTEQRSFVVIYHALNEFGEWIKFAYKRYYFHVYYTTSVHHTVYNTFWYIRNIIKRNIRVVGTRYVMYIMKHVYYNIQGSRILLGANYILLPTTHRGGIYNIWWLDMVLIKRIVMLILLLLELLRMKLRLKENSIHNTRV